MIEGLKSIVDYINEDVNNWIFVGSFCTIIFRVSIYLDKRERRKVKKFLDFILSELNDWFIVVFGGMVFYGIGDYVITGFCNIQPFIEAEKARDFYIDTQEGFFFVGGALFGLSLYAGYKWYIIRRDKKLEEAKNRPNS